MNFKKLVKNANKILKVLARHALINPLKGDRILYVTLNFKSRLL